MQRHDSFIIIFEGIDGSGKATLTHRLKNYLLSMGQDLLRDHGIIGQNIERFAFPDYNGPVAAAINDLMRRELDTNLRYTLASMFALDRKVYNYGPDDDKFIKIFDRYYPSNWAYNWPEIDLDALINLEADSFVGDVVFVLDVDPEESFKRRQERRDNYEKDIKLLTKSRENYLELAKQFGWVVLDGTQQTGDLVDKVYKHITTMNNGIDHNGREVAEIV